MDCEGTWGPTGTRIKVRTILLQLDSYWNLVSLDLSYSEGVIIAIRCWYDTSQLIDHHKLPYKGMLN